MSAMKMNYNRWQMSF